MITDYFILKFFQYSGKSNNKYELHGVQELTQSPTPSSTSDLSITPQCSNDTSSLQDKNVLSALSGLQIVDQTSSDCVNNIINDHQNMFDSTDDENDCEQQPLIVPVVPESEESNKMIETGIGKPQLILLSHYDYKIIKGSRKRKKDIVSKSFMV